MIALKSSENHNWPWASHGEKAEAAFRNTYPSLFHHMKALEDRLRKRQDKGRHWWELRSCDYYDAFEQPKIVYQEIGFHSRFALDGDGYYANNKTFLLRARELFLLGVLNSSVVWRILWADLPHMKDEAIAMQGFAIERIPIPEPPVSLRGRMEALVQALLDLTVKSADLAAGFLHWLDERGIERITPRLEAYWELNATAFQAEMVRAKATKLVGSARQWVLDEHHQQVSLIRPILENISRLEIELQHLVFDLYGLTPDEARLLRSTAPPRDPLALVESAGPKAVAGGGSDSASSAGEVS
ncbi:MAG: TaqI-like C-terminal specificity domain-containing protein [bacterium]